MKYIPSLFFLFIVACNSPKTETSKVPFAQTLKLQGKSAFGIVDQNGDTLIVTSKDTTISWTYAIYDTIWRRKGSVVPPVDTIPVPPTEGYPGYSLVYSNDFEPGTKLDPNQCGRCAINTSIVKSGQGSARFEYRKGDAQISGAYRSEQQLDGSLSPNGKEIIVEYDEYFETLSSNCNGLSMQWHGNQSGTSGSGSMWISGGRFVFQNQPDGCNGCPNKYSPSIGTIPIGKWIHMKYEIRWSSGSDGYIRAYVDGALKYSTTGKNCDGRGQYPKYGINMFDGNNTTVVYFDNMKMYLK